MNVYKLFSVLIVIAMLLGVAPSAPAYAQDMPGTIVEVAAGNDQFSTLVAAVQAADLAETLSADGPYTVFAPTNAAFNKLGKPTIDALLADPEKLAAILLYHVVPGKLMAADVLASASAETAGGAPVVFTQRNGQAFVNNARITATDVEASNGVIHVIDSVILPAENDIVDTAAANPQFKTLVAAVQAAGLVDTLKGEGPFTVFAPTDAAFNKLGKSTIDALIADPDALKDILLYHTLAGSFYASDVLGSTSKSTAAGADVVFTSRNNQVFINNARITTTDILTTNGVIHVIDTVLLPPSMDLVDTAAANPQFKTLVAAVEAAGLVDTLKTGRGYTIFAPTDAAFAKLPAGTVEALIEDPETLKSILLYHTFNGRSYSGDVAKLSSAYTASKQYANITSRNGQLFINNARITTPDVLASNGVIHVIDTVILPPDLNIVETAVANPQFKTLVAAVQAAGLAETLSGKGPFTIFAPTDAAFAKLPAGTVEALLADPEALKSILLYHAAPGRTHSGKLTGLASVKTVNGADAVVTVKNQQAYINNARITATDILTTNGVIHVIDTVILPPSMDIVETAAANPQFKTLVAAVEAAGLVDTLKGEGPFTIFAPTDAAFAKLPAGTVEALIEDPEALKSILLYHAVSGSVYSGNAVKLTSAETVNGAEVTLSVRNGQLYINDARVTTADILTSNGVIHVIDTVILPPAE